MDWFERLTGFRENTYGDTRSKLTVDGGYLSSLVNGKRYGIGNFDLTALSDLRAAAKSAHAPPGKLKVQIVTGDVRPMHRDPTNVRALFQVASQFNALEMVSPEITPEQGVTRYQSDRTQGPACAIAAGAATIYRNYFVPVGNEHGQTATRQLDGLAEIGADLSAALGQPVSALWEMKNGYALCSRGGLQAIAAHLTELKSSELDALRAKLRIGLHSDIEVTESRGAEPGPLVSQAFCSALPVGYSSVPKPLWEPFARLVLEAAYEATMLCGVLNSARARSNKVLLTSLGGGAFGNDEQWIHDSIARALDLFKRFALDVRLVSFGQPSRSFQAIADVWSL
ncbi:hypothetical protein [Bradyrhizobium sp. ARR65]|uniref:hypothetical protein n=1 Tax=Bradyrhizobium sp. ARR65 TaxID=1040989 RepID=UPI000466858D|nr:hypothetical protein [Bradyrhizobium sp. ARR65]